jgi:hypothetical protein
MTQLSKSKISEVAEEIKSLMIEAVFTSHWVMIEAHHEIGRLIVENFGDDMSNSLPSLAQKVGRSERTLYRAAQLYRKFPRLDKIPGGKAVSMNRLITEHLIEPGEPKEEKCHHCPIINHCPKI